MTHFASCPLMAHFHLRQVLCYCHRGDRVTIPCLAELDHKVQVSIFPAAAIASVLQILADCSIQIIRETKKLL